MKSVVVGACVAVIVLGPSFALAQDPGRGDDRSANPAWAARGQGPQTPQERFTQDRAPPQRSVQSPSSGAPSGLQGVTQGRPDRVPPGYEASRGRPAPGQGGAWPQYDRGGFAGGPGQIYGTPDPGRSFGRNGPGGSYGDLVRGPGYRQDDQGYDRGGFNGRGFNGGGSPQGYDRSRNFAGGGRAYDGHSAAPYRFPAGYDRWSGHTWRQGEALPPIFISTSYFIDDYYDYGLPRPDYGFQWVRVGADAVLIDLSDGRVVDEVSGVYYY